MDELKRRFARLYLELAKATDDVGEREKFLGYATVYEQLSDQSQSEGTSTPEGEDREHRHVPKRHRS